MSKQIDWRNNPDGFPPLDLGMGPDERPREEFTEKDLELIWANPITQVALDAATKSIITMGQAIAVGYQDGQDPKGLDTSTVAHAFFALAKRIETGDLIVPESAKKQYAYIYEIENEGLKKERISKLWNESSEMMVPHWAEFYKRDKNKNLPLVKLIEKFIDEDSDVYLKKYPEAYPYITQRFLMVFGSAIIKSKTHMREDVITAHSYFDNLFSQAKTDDYREALRKVTS